MIELIRERQLALMLLLCGACLFMVLLLLFTQFITKRRKLTLIGMELVAFFLLWFDRLAYVYAGETGTMAFYMVRISNFLVFFLTSGIVLVFDFYISDLILEEGGLEELPSRLRSVRLIAMIGMLLSIISAFTGFYYTIDENNLYHRGTGFLIAYIVPVLAPIILYTVIRQYKDKFSPIIYRSLVLYIFVPIGCGILQIFTYGISIVNMSMALVSVFLYFFTYIDINREVERAHTIEMQNAESEKEHLKRLFDQTATSFVSAVEKKDDFTKGNAVKIAEYAERIAAMCGKDEDECERIYYTALLHDVGMIGIPDSVIKNEEDPDKWDYDAMRQKPLIGSEILSSITEYPYLSEGAEYSHERYNGTGYPKGLKGEEIPESARIIAVADAYVTMTTRKRYRDARPNFVARERFIKGAGEEFDPVFADMMVRIIDAQTPEEATGAFEEIPTELSCDHYRKNVSIGIPVENAVKKISFYATARKDADAFSAPSIIVFDAYDRRVHSDEKTIREYHYLEYGEIWFDDHMIVTEARKMEVKREEALEPGTSEAAGTAGAAGASAKTPAQYEIIAGRFEDHVRLTMKGPALEKEIVIALPDSSKSFYIGLTGEHCELTEIKVTPTGEVIGEGDIERIATAISYTDHFESDIPNIQIDRTRSDVTAGIEVEHKLKLLFHSMSLPGANLVWHCPYIILFGGSDGKVGGADYEEYAVLKLNGESDGSNEFAENKLILKHRDDFPGWEAWKAGNRAGVECEVSVEKKGNRIVIEVENLGISIENITMLKEDRKQVYIALTGDQVALTDIRVVR